MKNLLSVILLFASFSVFASGTNQPEIKNGLDKTVPVTETTSFEKTILLANNVEKIKPACSQSSCGGCPTQGECTAATGCIWFQGACQ